MKYNVVLAAVFFLLLACIILPSHVSSQTTVINLSIRNEPPHVGEVLVDKDMVPNINATTLLWCNATVTDPNGEGDLRSFSATLWHPRTATESSPNNIANHYTPVSWEQAYLSPVSRDVYFLFEIKPQVNEGEWICKINATDSENNMGANQTNLTFYPKTCINGKFDEGEVLTDCGGKCPQCLDSSGLSLSAFIGSYNTSLIIVTSATPEDMAITGVAASDLNSSSGSLSSSNIIITPVNMNLSGLGSASFDVLVFLPPTINASTNFSGWITFYSDKFNVSFPLTVYAIMPNFPPEILDVVISYPIVLTINRSTEVWCNATVRDDNGFSDVKSATVILWHNETALDYSPDDERNHYTSSQIIFTPSNQSNNIGFVSGSFHVLSNAESGLWYCKVSVTDTHYSSAVFIKPFTIYPLSCSDGIFAPGDEQLTDCGIICPPCLMADDLRVTVVAGALAKKDTALRSYALEPLYVSKFNISNFSTYDRDIQLSGIMSIIPETVMILPKSTVNVEADVLVPTGTPRNSYYGNIGVLTNTTVNATIKAIVDVIMRGEGYLNVDINKTCANHSVKLHVTEERYGTPLRDAKVKVFYSGAEIYSATTPLSGDLKFMALKTGLYSIQASREGYHSDIFNTTVEDCFTQGTCSDGIKNCHDNSCEDGIDCGGPCPPCTTCFNGVRDNGENGIDCGGPCHACHCFNGMQDEDETGIDCGGSCERCPNLPFIPSLVLNVVPVQVMNGDTFNMTVTDDRGRFVSALIRINKSNGTEMLLRTNAKGFTTAKTDVPGLWRIMALKAGYIPASNQVYVNEQLILQVVRVVSYLVPFTILVALILYLGRRRTKVAMDYAALSKIIEADKLRDYRRIYVASNVYSELSEKAGEYKDRITSIKLSDTDMIDAENLSSANNISIDLAEAVVVADIIKAKILIAGASTGSLGEEYNRIKIAAISEKL